jgi:hypothetical protein
MTEEVTEKELGDLVEIGRMVVSWSGGRGDIGRMQEIFLRNRRIQE